MKNLIKILIFLLISTDLLPFDHYVHQKSIPKVNNYSDTAMIHFNLKKIKSEKLLDLTQSEKLSITYPNGGEILVVGDTIDIRWDGIDSTQKVRIEFSIDDGQNWILIVPGVIGYSYRWQVPNLPTDLCLFRIISLGQLVSEDEFAIIPAGTFKMGDIRGTGTLDQVDELPVHEVTISRDLIVHKYEVTQALYKEVTGINPTPESFKGDSLPVVRVNWFNAVKFCNQLSDLEGFNRCYSWNHEFIEDSDSIVCNWDADGYRLLTEAEWEYACRAGTETDFHTGNTEADLSRSGWYNINSDITLKKVGLKEPNQFGLYDMHGNVYEWCWDWYADIAYEFLSNVDPRGWSASDFRVIRGGGYSYDAQNCRSSSRSINYPESPTVFGQHVLGFRIVRNK